VRRKRFAVFYTGNFVSFKFFYIGLDALRVTRRFGFRSALIILATGLGIGGVITSVNFAAEGRREALDQIARLGVNALTVAPQQDRGAAGRARTGGIVHTLVAADFRGIQQRVSSIVRASAIASGEFRIKSADLSKTAQIVGCQPDYPKIKNWSLASGQWFSDNEDRRSARVAVVGYRIAQDIFGSDLPVGRRLFIDRTPFQIIGVIEERGQGLDTVSEDDQVYIPLRTAMHRVMNVDYYSGLLLKVDRLEAMDETTASVESLLRARHHRLGNLPDDFQVRNQKTLIDTENESSRRLGFYVRTIGIGGLAVSGLGIMAISWIAVKGRIVEIGTRRALGAQIEDVFVQLLMEAAFLSFLGCAFGLVLGWEGSLWIAKRASPSFEFDWSNAKSAVVLAALMNLAFAVVPALRAARVSPIRALRQE
jgi:putative ABC transport system permease protein